MTDNPYDKRYTDNPSYWGDEPGTIARRFAEQGLPILRERFPDGGIRIVDLGCGDGKDALFYAQQGLHVTGIDISQPGIDALRAKAIDAGLDALIEAIPGDIARYKLDREYHAIVSSGALHYIPPESRNDALAHYKRHVVAGGIFAASVIVEKPFVERAPDADPNVTLFRSGEILRYLWDWEVVWFVEDIRPCNSGGVPHRHAVNRVLARKVDY